MIKKFTDFNNINESEHHHEQDMNMAKVQLEDIVKNAQTILNEIENQDELPAWVSDKISITNHNMEAVEGWLRR